MHKTSRHTKWRDVNFYESGTARKFMYDNHRGPPASQYMQIQHPGKKRRISCAYIKYLINMGDYLSEGIACLEPVSFSIKAIETEYNVVRPLPNL